MFLWDHLGSWVSAPSGQGRLHKKPYCSALRASFSGLGSARTSAGPGMAVSLSLSEGSSREELLRRSLEHPPQEGVCRKDSWKPRRSAGALKAKTLTLVENDPLCLCAIWYRWGCMVMGLWSRLPEWWHPRGGSGLFTTSTLQSERLWGAWTILSEEISCWRGCQRPFSDLASENFRPKVRDALLAVLIKKELLLQSAPVSKGLWYGAHIHALKRNLYTRGLEDTSHKRELETAQVLPICCWLVSLCYFEDMTSLGALIKT